MTDQKRPSTLSKDDVLQWLGENPDFLIQNPQALEMLNPPKESQGRKVADFQHYMVKKLKADRDAIMDNTREIIEISRSNMQNTARIHEAVLSILDCHTIEQFSQVLTTEICNILDVDLAAFVFEISSVVKPYVNLPGIRLVPEGTIAHWLGSDAVLLESNIHGVEEIYGGGARLVRSQLITRLDITTDIPPSALAFGSRDPEMFAANQGVEMIGFLTRVIEKSLERILFID